MKKKTVAFIDYANIKAWSREKGLSFDLKVLYEWLKTTWKAQQIYFYYGTDERNPKSEQFLKRMIQFGYVVKTKPVKYFRISLLNLLNQRSNKEMLKQISPNIQKALFQEIKELEKKRIRLLLPKANFDVEITLDLVLNKDRSERILLFSGDSDFTTIVRYLRRSKKEVIVLSGRKYLAGDLMNAANRFITLERLGEKVKRLLKKQDPLSRASKKSKTIVSE